MQIREQVMKVVSYTNNMKSMWDNFIEKESRNGFIFHKMHFLEYHKNRFQDCSLLFLDEKENIIALFPAALKNNNIISHPGSSYGGLVLKKYIKLSEIFEIVELMKNFYNNNFGNINIEIILSESFNLEYGAEDVAFVLWQLGFNLKSKEISTVIDINKFRLRLGLRRTTKQYLCSKSYLRLGITYEKVIEKSDILGCYKLIEQNLASKYKKKPTHTMEELFELIDRFPQDIDVFAAKRDDEVISTYIMFRLNDFIVHTFYIAKSLEKENVVDIGLVDFMTNFYFEKGFNFLNFGISSRDKVVKWGIHTYKEQFSKFFVTRDKWILNAKGDCNG